MKKILILDNYDSFTYNLYQLIGMHFSGDIIVKRIDEIDPFFIDREKIDRVIISPGPMKPENVPLTMQVIKKYYKVTPIFGVCLGMQCINEVFGGKTIKAPYPMHGKTATIDHIGKGVFQDIPQKIKVARYHSLVIDMNSEEFTITAKLDNGVIMGIQHKEYPLWGVQFHPESFLTEFGSVMIKNFLDI